jgi:hypothetical protein
MTRPLNDPAPAPLGHREGVVRRAWIVLKEAPDAGGCRLPEGVDRLIVVSSADDAAAARRDQPQDLEIARVEILVLVDDEQVVIDTGKIIVLEQGSA